MTEKPKRTPQELLNRWKPSGVCNVCKVRPATEMWADGGTMAAIHGMYEFRCKACCLIEQLAHARKMAADIPRLERELAEALGGGETAQP